MSGSDIPLNQTMLKFGAPDSRIRQYRHWSVLLRPAQATLGALVLVAHDPVGAFSQLEPPSFAELHRVTGDLEAALARSFAYDRLNYLMLMMVDPDVHFHVLPRYAGEKRFAGRAFQDSGWPGPPDLARVNPTDDGLNREIREYIADHWPD